MKIKEDVIAKLIKVWKEKRSQILKGNVRGFTLYQTEEGGKVCTTKLKNGQGWYAIVCFYECADVVEVYDMHVFDRYRERFWIEDGEDPITAFIKRGNVSGTLVVKDREGKTEKKVRDGAILGNITGDIIYHKTFLNDEMCRDNKLDYLFEL